MMLMCGREEAGGRGFWNVVVVWGGLDDLDLYRSSSILGESYTTGGGTTGVGVLFLGSVTTGVV